MSNHKIVSFSTKRPMEADAKNASREEEALNEILADIDAFRAMVADGTFKTCIFVGVRDPEPNDVVQSLGYAPFDYFTHVPSGFKYNADVFTSVLTRLVHHLLTR